MQYDKAFREWMAAKEVRVWGNSICQSPASVWKLNRDQHPSLESSPGPVIYHTQEGLGRAGCEILRIPVQDELIVSSTTTLQGQRRVRVTLYFASNYHWHSAQYSGLTAGITSVF